MRKVYLLVTVVAVFAGRVSAQEVATSEPTVVAADSLRAETAVAGDSLSVPLAAPIPVLDVAPFSMYGISPYGCGYMGWNLHKGFNASIGMNVTFSPDKYAPSGVGFGQNAAFMYAVPVTDRPLQKVGMTGDIYTKNCSLGNRDMVAYLEAHGCEVGVNGISWYTLYYIDTHLDVWPAPVRLGGRLLGAWLGHTQRRMLSILKEAGFSALPPYRVLKEQAKGLAPMSCALGAGWLMAAEMAGWVRRGYRKVLCCQSFGCQPGHICARGRYAALMRALPGSRIVGVDFDPSTGEGTVESRVRMLLDTEPDPPAF